MMSSPTTSKGQLGRLLSLVPYLQRRPGARMTEVAADFGITPAQLRKDLGVLYMCGLPGLLPGDLIEIDMEAVDGEGIIFLTNADFLARPLRFTPDEVLPLLLGLRTLRELAGGQGAESIDSALVKLTAVAGESVGLADRVRIGVRAAEEPVREAIAAALQNGVRLRLTYDAPSGRRTSRLVDPHSLRMRDGAVYLEAWSDQVEDSAMGWRSFRLDRIVTADLTAEPTRTHSGGPEDWAARWSAASVVTLDLTPPATWVAEHYPVEDTRTRPDGSLRVRLRVVDPLWLQGLLLRLGADATVVTPSGAATAAREEACAALEHYSALFGDEPQ